MRVFGYRSRSTRTAARVRFRRKMGELLSPSALFLSGCLHSAKLRQ